MKYHKIPNVEKSVCTAEQMIAYNIAFRLHISYANQFEEDAIFSALLAGLYNYLSNFHIFSSYEDIGRAFPAHYLKEGEKA